MAIITTKLLNDTLIGGNGNDTLIGGTGNDYLQGGSGNDTYIFAKGSGMDTIYDVDGTVGNTDTVQFLDVRSTEVTSLTRNGYDLVIKYGTTDQLIIQYYFIYNKVFQIEQIKFSDGVTWGEAAIKANVITNGSANNDTITGYNDSSNRIFGLAGNDSISGGALADQIDGGTGNDVVYGNAGDDSLIGGDGADSLYGGDGADTLNGGTGNDRLFGDRGNDTYIFAKGDGKDTIQEFDNTLGNTDTVQFSNVRSAEITALTRANNDLVLQYGTTDQLSIQNYFVGIPAYVVEQIKFSDGVTWDEAAIKARVITNGTANNDTITGYNDGTNRIFGLAGNDSLSGGALDDQIDGGTGNDTLYGNAGNDSLVGGAGADTMIGGIGNDTYTVDNMRDIVIETSTLATEIDQVYSSVSYTLSANVENLTLAGSAAIDGTGNTIANVLLGNNASNTLNGNDGDDKLDGSGGDDTLVGGNGNDTLIGGTGNDYLQGGNGNDTYIFSKGSGMDTINDADGTVGNTDTVQFLDVRSTEVTSLTRNGYDLVLKYGTTDQLTIQYYFIYNKAFEVEKIKFSDGIALNQATLKASTGITWDEATIKANVITNGSANNDTITGYNDGSNRIFGLAGNDSISGGALADQIDAGTGNDVVYGNAGDDSLIGGVGDDTLYGDDGADTLNGGTGNDRLFGNRGNDTYIFAKGDGKDTIQEFDSTLGNTDTVQFSNVLSTEVTALTRANNDLVLQYGTTDQVSIQNYFVGIPAYVVEQIKFSDGVNWNEAAIKARVITNGTANNDTITGYNDGTNRIFGLAGNDSISGGALADQIDGGTGNDTLYGNAGNDSLVGGEGADTMIGGLGQDNYTLTEAVAATDTLRIATGDSLVTGYDKATGFTLGTGTINTTGVDKLDLASTLIAPNTIGLVNGQDSGSILTHSINNGIVSFQGVAGTTIGASSLVLNDALNYLKTNIITAGETVAFIAGNDTFVFQEAGVNDTLIELVGVTASRLNTTGLGSGAVWIA